MTPSQPADAAAPRLVVFLPCRSLDDFPRRLDDGEADDLLAAWTGAWHPRLVAACGMPGWAGADLPPPAGPLLGIVPRSSSDRVAARGDATPGDVRILTAPADPEAVAAAALAAVDQAAVGSADRWADDFRALGLAVLLTELLARRMRTQPRLLDSTELAGLVTAAAAAAVEGRDDAARAALAACFGHLEAARARFYPVDAWLVDLVLLAASTKPEHLGRDCATPVPLGFVADAGSFEALAGRHPEIVAAIRRRIDDGTASICGGPAGDPVLDACTPEEILAAFADAGSVWERVLGRRPAVFARRSGGGSALLPGVLTGVGYAGAVWGTFDGAPLPDPHAGRIAWEGTAGAAIEALARPPLDVRGAASVLDLPARLGDAMDRDHVAVVTFAHHAGTANRWHALVRRIGAWSTALGTFVTPDDLLCRTADAGTRVSFGPDAFPPTPPPVAPGDPLGAAVETAAAAARGIVARAARLGPAAAAAAARGTGAAPRRARAGAVAGGWPGWWANSRRPADEFVLESDEIHVAVHPECGGILALRRPDGPNRLSQRLARRDGDEYGRMVAERIERGPTVSGTPGIVSRGRLLDGAGRPAGTFVQGLSLVPGLPLVVIDVEIVAAAGTADLLAQHHVACRFAWHENDDVEFRRSIHTQAVPTGRTHFTAPHFVELVPAARRGVAAEPVTILCGGLSWHERSTPHVLDTLLAVPGRSAVRRLAVGLGLAHPGDAALELLAGAVPGSGPRPGPANVRVAVLGIEERDGRVARARVGVLETAGSAGEVRLEWARAIAGAAACELDGRPRPGAAVAIEGGGVVVFLRAHEWLAVDLDFGA